MVAFLYQNTTFLLTVTRVYELEWQICCHIKYMHGRQSLTAKRALFDHMTVPVISKFIASRIRKEITHEPPSTLKDGRFIRPLTNEELVARQQKLILYDSTHGRRHMTDRKRNLIVSLKKTL